MVQERSSVLDSVFHALAHPARRLMLRSLASGERNLTELAAPLQMSFPAASKHVRVLERAKLVRRRLVGRTHLCRIEAKPLAQATQWLEKYRQFWEANFQRLDDLLDELKVLDETQAPDEARVPDDLKDQGEPKGKKQTEPKKKPRRDTSGDH